MRFKVVVTLVATGAALATLRPLQPLELPPVAGHRPVAYEEPSAKPYVLPLVAIHPDGSFFGTATAFVVDRTRGLLATAAHTNIGSKHLVRLPDGIWIPANRIRTNTNADMALLAVPDGMGEFLPPAPRFRWRPLTANNVVAVLGWRVGRPPELPTPAFRPVTRFLSVIRPDVTLCEISLESCVHVLSIIERSVREGYVNERDRAYLYNRYIFTIDTDTDDGTVQYGISGGPAVDGDGRVAGVIVMSNGYRILLVPIDEVQRLME